MAKADAAGNQYTYKTETLSDLVQWDNATMQALSDWVLQPRDHAGRFRHDRRPRDRTSSLRLLSDRIASGARPALSEPGRLRGAR